MNKVELIKAVAEATNNTQKDIKAIMEAVQDVTYGALVKGDEVKLIDGVTATSVATEIKNFINEKYDGAVIPFEE